MDKNKLEEQKLRLLRQALIEGEGSGWIENFDPVDFKAKLKENLAANAKASRLIIFNKYSEAK
ncbi:type II toxin-antitoxin system ParD family antitoxin [Dyadobacter subterraneus]|uniref:Type II toxin-antitoxin system ParD family antitoxin n=1 Tax=Dyadobacter subterraneus TaxID=2773304 RepID=A0ABR9WEM5_9BACT|nr:type II toxin-antitoxin system ParD family antitoxin [Dyadobacter subterraneus]MBE9463940.1 type II toxin-antitoxin system ParD family antitoxin [Dyadobacter subterraneus]